MSMLILRLKSHEKLAQTEFRNIFTISTARRLEWARKLPHSIIEPMPYINPSITSFLRTQLLMYLTIGPVPNVAYIRL